MDNQALQQIKDTIASSQSIVIAVSQNPNIDQMAAALSLYLKFSSQGKSVTVASPTEPIVELSSLVGIDKVNSSKSGSGGDLVVSFPYREGEIEKVSYTIDNGQLNIVVKAGPDGLNFNESDVVFSQGGDKPNLLITVGVNRLSDIQALFSQDSLDGVTVVNIDNSSQNDGFGALVLVSPRFSSLSEQVGDLMLNLGYEIDIDEGQNLLAGIMSATNNFQNQNTSYLAFEIASILMKKGAARVKRPALQKEERAQQPQQQRQFQPNARQQQLRQPQPARRDNRDRQDRREAIRDALRSRSLQDNNTRPQSFRQPQQIQSETNPQDDQAPNQTRDASQKPPSDWLTPKVYKGSSNV